MRGISAVAGLALVAAMGAGVRLEPVEDEFDTRTRRTGGPDPEPKPDRAEVAPVETAIDPVEPPNDGEGLPNRLSIDRSSRFYTSAGVVVGLVFDGQDVTGRVVEFDRDGGWVRLANVLPGKTVSSHDVRTAPKSFGKVQPYWRGNPSRQMRRQLARIG